ncbi:MAG: hypothetical protein EAZ42_00025 [Verrucomicrobia bacterium]|nr:MAG: hypothetical protein EAZ42_00025 [Verrucomicrobiota bacterium]
MAKIAEAEALFSQIGEILKFATKAEDLDDILADLSGNQQDEYRANPEFTNIFRKLNQAREVVSNWQEYLIAAETGDNNARLEQLQRISSQLSSTPVVPRSMVLRLINQPTPERALEPKATQPVGEKVLLGEIKQKLTESGDIAAADAEIKALYQNSSIFPEDPSFPADVRKVNTLRILEPSMSESELFANIRNFKNGPYRDEFVFTRAIDQIALNAIARNYGIEALSAKNVTVHKALESMATDAVAAKDWKKLRRVLNSLEILSRANIFIEDSKIFFDSRIISLIELGEAAEARDDFEAAINAYLEASEIEGRYLRRQEGEEKLANLKVKSPEKVAILLPKAKELRQLAETARRTAEMQMRENMMTRRDFPNQRPRMPDSATLRPMIEEVVADFLKDKRLEQQNASETKPPAKVPVKSDE